MKKAYAGFLLLIAFTAPLLAQQLELPRPSPKASLTQRVGLTDLTITYSRPSVRGRTVWGDLVPFDKPWRTGANEPTTFEVSDEVTVNGQPLPGGKYSVVTIPGRDEWTVIFSKQSNLQATSNYDPAQDALRVRVRPERSSHPHETLMFAIPEVSQDSATVELAWENVIVPFTVKAKTQEQVLANINRALSAMENWRIPMQAANYALDNNLSKDEAMRWVDRSIAINENFQNLNLKARILAEEGKLKDAIVTAERALKVGRASGQNIDFTAAEKRLAEWKTKARM